MSRTTFFAPLVSVFLLYLAGCSAGLTAIQPQKFTTASHYHAADITVMDLRSGYPLLSAHSPDSVTLYRGAAYSATARRGTGYSHHAGYKVIVGTKDYERREILIRKNTQGWHVGDVIVGSLNGLLIVDPPSGAAWLLVPNDITDVTPGASPFRQYNGLRVTLQSDLPELPPAITEKMRSVRVLQSNLR